MCANVLHALHLDTSVGLEKCRYHAKIDTNYNWDLNGVFSVCSLVRMLMMSI